MKVLLLFIPLLCAVGQQSQSPPKKDSLAPLPTAQEQIKALSQEVKALGEEVRRLKVANETIMSAVSNINSSLRDIMPLENDAAELDPSGTGYQAVATSEGRFFLSVEKTEPYLDGQRVYLKIGNPSLVTFNGCRAEVRWNTRPPKRAKQPENWTILAQELDALDSWEKKARSQEFDLTTSLLPGAWTAVNFVLPETESSQLGYLKVKLTVNRAVFLGR